MISTALLVLLVLFAALAIGMHVALALVLTAAVALYSAQPMMVGHIIANSLWSSLNSWELLALPMFIWMGEILYRSRLSADLFNGLAPWLNRLPGQLLHINVVGSAVFAAVSGSSAATSATIGRIALPQLKQRGYSEKLAIGSLAGAGTLGLLIPPSIILIVYGAATEQSIARLFVAGLIPGIVLALMLMLMLALLSTKAPSEPKLPTDWGARLRGLHLLAPTVALIVFVIGSIYAGLASPTEAAVVGVFCAHLLIWWQGELSRQVLIDALMGATKVSAMICFILAGAAVLTTAMGFTGIPLKLAAAIGQLDLSQLQLIAMLTVLFVIMGCLLDGISMVVLTTSVVIPMIQTAGIDLIWFGIYIVVVVEMAQITPPVGFNLFVLQSLTGRSILWIAGATIPFFLVLVMMVVLLALFPELVYWLPQQLFGS
ncbi:MAG: TRAP transporter large permease subunit [Gammaproteobacteria bacterium]|nr:TRAP transporter large permease subunit [Gammaproteobacteria bacterium]